MTSMLTRTHAVDGGRRVDLRLGRRSDVPAVAALLAGFGLATSDLELRRLLSFDPKRRCVLCAFEPVDGAETLVGVGAIDFGRAAPDTLVADPGVRPLLARELVERGGRRARPRRVA